MKSLVLACVLLFGSVGLAYALDSNLTWTNPVTTFGVQVEKASSVGGTYVMINQTAVNATSYTDTDNVAGATACYRIAYFNTSGVGPYATSVCKTFPQIPTQTPANFGVN